MTTQEYLEALERVRVEGAERIASAETEAELTEVRNTLVGRKSGRLSHLMRELASLPESDRREAGARANSARATIEEEIGTRAMELGAKTSPQQNLDLSMPARQSWRGAKHPVTLIIEEIEGIFRDIGFTIALGPEAELEWYNFGALNFPADHPAMDMHDTLYLSDDVLLRTHTSPV
ncbi:MAG: phenylalanine--tRNA ligase subunit alpha, partial [Gemmatimonadota bacterium]|nr:phenylalanine--tRNA ligase subunit alpha [Gemmatimonadota bacterium]